MNDHWFVYIVQCADNSLYTGITTDIERRLNEHNHHDKLGARYTRHRRPVRLVYQEQLSSHSQALCREHAIKKLKRKEKEQLIYRTPKN